MNHLSKLLMTSIALLFFTHTAFAQVSKRGTKTEAMAIAEKVKTMWRTMGPAKTIQAVNKLQHNLKNKDLYPWVGHIDGYVVAHYFHALRGLKTAEDTDQAGRSIMTTIVNLAKSKGVGWVRYDWPNPITKRIDAKVNYVLSMDREYFVIVGVFRKLKDEEIRKY